MSPQPREPELERLLPARRGHFLLESGHHGDLWLDLELLFYEPNRIRPFAEALARHLSAHRAQVVCGPLVEGAFVASIVAAALDVPFTYSERTVTSRAGLFPVDYVLPKALRARLKGKRVAIVNDVINAGSAVRGTARALADCGAQLVAVGSLAVLGGGAGQFSSEAGIPLETLTQLPNAIWAPADCPLCARRVPVDQA